MKIGNNLISTFVFLFVLSHLLFSQSGWEQLDSGTSSTLRAVHFLDVSTGYVAGDNGTILKTTNGGETWEDVSEFTDDFYGIHFLSPDTGVVAGANGLIVRTLDGGNNWSVVSIDVNVDLLTVSFYDDVGIIGGQEQTILTSDDIGESWTTYQTGYMGFGLQGSHMLDSDHGYLSGQSPIFQPTIYKTDDGGETWQNISFLYEVNGVITEGAANDVFFINPYEGFIAGNLWTGEGAIAHSTDGGNSWNTIGVFEFVHEGLRAIDFPSEHTGFTAGSHGAILATQDGGDTWELQTTNVFDFLHDIMLVDSLNGYAVGENGVILKTTVGGQPMYSLTLHASPGEGGNVTGEGEYTEGKEVNISAPANQGWKFVEWTGDIEYVDNPYSDTTEVTMPAEDIELTANFEMIYFHLSLEADPTEGGNLTGEGEYNMGEEINISAVANQGWEFVEWTGDTDNVDDPGSKETTVSMPADDVTLIADFMDVTEIADHDKALLKIYPNPASTKFMVEANQIIKQVSLINISGQKVISRNFDKSKIEINVNNLQPGVYFMKIHIPDEVITKRVEIIR